MAGIQISLDGLPELKKILAEKQSARDLPDVIGTLVVAGVKHNFETGTDADTGAAWPALKSRNGQPLRDKGGLMRSIHYERIGAAGVSVGTNLIYAATHQKGDPNRVPVKAKALRFVVFGKVVFAKRVKIPQRKFLPETDMGLSRMPGLKPGIEKFFAAGWK